MDYVKIDWSEMGDNLTMFSDIVEGVWFVHKTLLYVKLPVYRTIAFCPYAGTISTFLQDDLVQKVSVTIVPKHWKG